VLTVPPGKDADRAAFGKVAQGAGAGIEVERHRLARGVEGDGQDHPVQRRGAAEDAVGKDAEIAAQRIEQVAHHQPVEDAVGVVRDQDQRAVCGDLAKVAAQDVEREAEAFGDHLPEGPAAGDLILITRGAADQGKAAGRVFQCADQRPAPA
jgi:hypothetical protein